MSINKLLGSFVHPNKGTRAGRWKCTARSVSSKAFRCPWGNGSGLGDMLTKRREFQSNANPKMIFWRRVGSIWMPVDGSVTPAIALRDPSAAAAVAGNHSLRDHSVAAAVAGNSEMKVKEEKEKKTSCGVEHQHLMSTGKHPLNYLQSTCKQAKS